VKSKLILAFMAVAISLCLFACSPASKQVSVDVTCGQLSKHAHITKAIQVPAGDSFTLSLCSNPTSEFRWSEAQISDQTALEQVDRKFVPRKEGQAGGREVWTFKTLKEGTSTISMEYIRPGKGEKPTRTFVLTVEVLLG